MSNLRDEIFNLKQTLDQLQQERQNLLQHFQIQENNYAATFKLYEEKVDLLLKQKEEKIEELLKQKCLLEAKILGESEEAEFGLLMDFDLIRSLQCTWSLNWWKLNKIVFTSKIYLVCEAVAESLNLPSIRLVNSLLLKYFFSKQYFVWVSEEVLAFGKARQ